MKKMSEVFELPISHERLEVYGPKRAGIPYAEAEKHAAHAINHVDALADALELLLNDKAMIHASNEKHLQAKAALAAYSGEL